MTLTEQIITIAICVLATMLTRFISFIIFREKKETPKFIKYISTVLPAAVFGMLVVYCLKNVDITSGYRGLPEFVGIAVTMLLHKFFNKTLVSIAGGTAIYLVLVNLIFI